MVIPGPVEREMEPLEVFRLCLDLLKDVRICALATTLEAKLRVRAMEYGVADSGIIYMLTEGGRKVRDILLNPNVSLAVWREGESGAMWGLTIAARAEIVDPGDQRRFPIYYEEYSCCIGRDVLSRDALPPSVKLIRLIPDVMELFNPSLEKDGCSAKQIWRR